MHIFLENILFGFGNFGRKEDLEGPLVLALSLNFFKMEASLKGPRLLPIDCNFSFTLFL